MNHQADRAVYSLAGADGRHSPDSRCLIAVDWHSPKKRGHRISHATAHQHLLKRDLQPCCQEALRIFAAVICTRPDGAFSGAGGYNPRRTEKALPGGIVSAFYVYLIGGCILVLLTLIAVIAGYCLLRR